jgi:restriction system protein
MPDPTADIYQPPPAPNATDSIYNSRWFAPKARATYESDLLKWEQTCAALRSQYEADAQDAEVRLAAYLKLAESKRVADLEQALWKRQLAAFRAYRDAHNAAVDSFRLQYEAANADAVVGHARRTLGDSDYPAYFPRQSEFDFNHGTGVLLVDFRLPAPNDLPTLKQVKYAQSTGTFLEKHLSEAEQQRLYDDVIYQITLRTVYELFQSDQIGALSTVVFNGIVTSTDRSTGNEFTACIVSIQVSRAAFEKINLAKVDPKACFRQLKGVGSSRLHSVTPVAPIMVLNRDDRRFVPSYAVAEKLHEGFNLAAMDWEDFEHLIREIFEKEFSMAGGEVKVTQASRDRGVDAVVFDPDPIRGGKIVIQAKRYAFTVDVSAVRDLYGTILNEGATKGILVTTSDYGPDAYEFSKGKPITLLNGSNLLHLLQKHGVAAHIDLAGARRLFEAHGKRAGHGRSDGG